MTTEMWVDYFTHANVYTFTALCSIVHLCTLLTNSFTSFEKDEKQIFFR